MPPTSVFPLTSPFIDADQIARDRRFEEEGRPLNDTCAACGNKTGPKYPVVLRDSGFREHAGNAACHAAASARIAEEEAAEVARLEGNAQVPAALMPVELLLRPRPGDGA